MNKYKVEFIETEKYIVDVYAENETEARTLADLAFQNEDFQCTGDIEIEINNVYDVTNTDDPFSPVNDCVVSNIPKINTRNITEYLKTIGRFPDTFTVDDINFTMSHYDLEGYIIRYSTDKTFIDIECKTIISRYDDGRFNPKSLDWLVVDIV